MKATNVLLILFACAALALTVKEYGGDVLASVVISQIEGPLDFGLDLRQ